MRLSILRLRPRQRRMERSKTRLWLEVLEARVLMSVDVVGVMEGTNSGNSSCGCTPPDPAVAAGPNQVVETVNSAYAVYDKNSGVLISRTSLRTLFAPLDDVQSLSDPVIVYNELAGQFAIGVLDYNSSASLSRFDFALSNDSDPGHGFSLQRYDMQDGIGSFDFADYPKMGYNADAYVISFNMFPTGGSFHVDTLSIDKNSLTGYLNIVSGSHSTMTPSVMHGANSGDPMWFVETGSGSAGNMKVIKMTNLLSGLPIFTNYTVSVPTYSSPPSATQPGGGSIPTLGSRVLDAAYYRGLLVAAHTIGSDGIARARWYEFDTTTSSPSLVQSGTVDQGPDVYTYFPTIEINSEYDLGLTFAESSSSEYFSMYVTGQSVNDYGSGTMQTPVVTHAGTSRYTSSRAGDYSGISVDPADGYTFWAANEYKGANSWNTGVAGFGVSPNPAALGAFGPTGQLLRTNGPVTLPSPLGGEGWVRGPANEAAFAAAASLAGADPARQDATVALGRPAIVSGLAPTRTDFSADSGYADLSPTIMHRLFVGTGENDELGLRRLTRVTSAAADQSSTDALGLGAPLAGMFAS